MPRRDNNARHNKQRAQQPERHSHRASPSLSPPAQLPTPLPEEQIPHLSQLFLPTTMDYPPVAHPPVAHPQPLGSPGHEALAETSSARLIDLDTPPFQLASLPVEEVSIDDQEEDDGDGAFASTYHSPPFREAPLPNQVGSPPPLPIPLRIPYPQDYFEDVGPNDPVDGGSSGHVRSPTFSRSRQLSPQRYSNSPSSSTLESLSRTIRDYVPSSVHIPVPTAGPSPPLVSRPIVSYAQFSASPTTTTPHQRSPSTQTHTRTTSQQEFEREYEREGEFGYGYGYGHEYAQPQPQRAAILMQTSSHVQHSPPSGGFRGSGLAQAMRRGAAGMTESFISRGGKRVTTAPASKRASGRMDVICWARWDTLNGRHVLILAYPAGLQMWDCADLASISEVFHLNFDLPEWELVIGSGRANRGDGGGDEVAEQVRVVHAAVLPPPSHRAMIRHGGKDPFAESRPLLGILLEDGDEDEREEEPRSTFVLYSLRTHQVMKMLSMPGLSSTFVPNELFIVISTTTPPTLHVLSSTTFDTLHTVNESSLEAYRTPSQHSTLSHHPGSASYSSSAISISNAISSTAQSAFNNSSTMNKGVLGGTSIDGKATNNDIDNNNYGGGHSILESTRPSTTHPHPVFALSHRLLAYASPSPAALTSPSLLGVGVASNTNSKANRRLSASSAGSTSQQSGGATSSLSTSPFGLGGAGITKMTQADVGQAALKVGESVFSGMKFLGGMALDAAKSRVTGKAASSGGTPEGRVGGYGHARSASRTEETKMRSGSPGGRFVSRSAPDNAGGMSSDRGRGPGVIMTKDRERRHSNVSSSASSSVPPSPQVLLSTVAPHTQSVVENGHYVTVVDLSPLLPTSPKSLKGTEGRPDSISQPRSASPTKIDEFNASRSQTLAGLQFSPDGTSLAVITRDGHSVKIFKLHPTPSTLLTARSAALEETGLTSGTGSGGFRHGDLDRKSATQTYDLHRGHTTAVVEGFDWARDGRWAALGTRNRTVHVFAVNPYGGPPDVNSHLEARVRNIELVESRLTPLKPLARVRSPKVSSPSGHPSAPLAFAFISPSDITFSPDLLPPYAPHLVTNSPTFSPSKPKRIVNYQDILLFDPVDGVLSLRRLIIDKHAVKESIGSGVAASVQALGVTGISFPGMGSADRLSMSPSTPAASRGGSRNSHLQKVGDPPMELAAKESVVATWDLRRKRDWVEFKRAVQPNILVSTGKRKEKVGRDWLAEGELSTCSNSPRVLPRSLYLSHQFSFHTLGEDYHALLRRYQLDITGTKIEVRRTIEISPYTSGGDNAAFIEGFSSPRDVRRISSSFDEPIASAISGSLDSSNLPIILPMYPNGIPGSNPRSFRSSIPIRTMAGIGDGVSEGLGRIRRDFHKARSPQLVARSESSLSGPVPLEFDEEDEDFLRRDTAALEIPSSHSHGGGDGITSREASRDGGASAADSASIVTPASSSTHQLMDADVVGTVDEEIWHGWDQEDKLAVEEAEQFDDIAVVGYQAEAQERRQHSQKNPVLSAESKRKGRSKRRG